MCDEPTGTDGSTRGSGPRWAVIAGAVAIVALIAVGIAALLVDNDEGDSATTSVPDTTTPVDTRAPATPDTTRAPETTAAPAITDRDEEFTYGTNDAGTQEWFGPCPPVGDGPHRYVFTLYALDEELSLEPGLDGRRLATAITDNSLTESEIVATYQRTTD